MSSEAQQNLFITRWLADAKRTRRFSRETARDIDWLLKQGRTLGVRAKLPLKLNFLWNATTGALDEQPDLYRLSHALDTGREYHWVYQVLSDEQWQGRRRLTLNPEVNGVYVLKSSLDAAFNEAGFQALLDSSGWRTVPEDADQYFLNTREPPCPAMDVNDG